MLLIGHGSRSSAGVDEYWELARQVAAHMPSVDVGCGFIELAAPDLDTAIDRLVERGAQWVVAVPLVLLGAGHLKNDGPAALHRGRVRHPGVRFSYARDLGIHPLVLELARSRCRTAAGHRAGGNSTDVATVLVGRGSTDPDANADLFKVTRLLSDSGDLGSVEPAFVSLTHPQVPQTLDRCLRLGATRIAVVPYFLFTGVLVDRIRDQASEWAASHAQVEVAHGGHLGPDPAVAQLVRERYVETIDGDVRMNCDLCVYRHPLPGHEQRVGAPIPASHGHHHPVAIASKGGDLHEHGNQP